jgi:nitrilase
MTAAAVIQLRGDGNLEENLARAGHWLDRAAKAGARLAVLPENFAYYGRRDLDRAAMDEDTPEGPARRLLADKAREHKLWLVGGTVPVFGEFRDRPHAACLLVNPEGREVARYDKIHLFDVHVEATGKHYRESADYRPGSEPVVADTPFGKIGLSVCYDLRFPEFYRLQVDAGAEILVAPSAFTAATGEAHWRLLLRARAVDNLCYVLGANLAHRDHPKRPTWGGSAIVDPWGRVLAEMAGEEGYALAEVDLEKQRRIRRNMPALEHRRFCVVKGSS